MILFLIRHGHIWRFKPRNVTVIMLDNLHCLPRYTTHLLHPAPRVWPLWSTLKGTFTMTSHEGQVEVQKQKESETRALIFLAPSLLCCGWTTATVLCRRPSLLADYCLLQHPQLPSVIGVIPFYGFAPSLLGFLDPVHIFETVPMFISPHLLSASTLIDTDIKYIHTKRIRNRWICWQGLFSSNEINLTQKCK